jgi:hypothetical protein
MNAANNETGKQKAQGSDQTPDDKTPYATLFTAFSTGRSYIFYVKGEAREDEQGKSGRDKRDIVQDCWKEVFKDYAGKDYAGWSFDRLEKYDKPLGEVATFNFEAGGVDEAGKIIEELRVYCACKLSARLNTEKIEAFFFTTGVAILSLRLMPVDSDKLSSLSLFFEKLQDEDVLVEVREKLKKIIAPCKKKYDSRMKDGEQRKGRSQKWSLVRFRTVDRKEADQERWRVTHEFSYPLFFVDHKTYEERAKGILVKVAGSQQKRVQQSDEARVSYKTAEIYVYWSEALVRDVRCYRDLIENNFIIAFASWYALVLMNKNSSFFLFEAFHGMVTGKHQSTADAVHQKNMAYKDVTDAALPIRWTTRRRDLFLLETIHRNWSSERWRKNIEERMKLLTLHHKRLEDEGNERTRRNLGYVGLSITLATVVGAIAELINLAEKYNEYPHWLGPVDTLKEVGSYASFVVFLAACVLLAIAIWFWLWPKLRSFWLWLGPKLRLLVKR